MDKGGTENEGNGKLKQKGKLESKKNTQASKIFSQTRNDL